MRPEIWYRLFFVLYCIEAGIFLMWAPWTPFWERALFGLPVAKIGTVLIRPWARGAVSGFGVVHVIWGLHDLYGMFFRRRSRQPS
jgi:hypothetical protein